MARIASTTTSGVDTSGGLTLDALMARAKAAQDRQAQIAAPRQIQSPWQGVAQMAQAFVNARQGAYAEDQVKQGRAQLAQLLSGVDPETGADPATAAQIYSLDPEAGQRAMQMAAEAIRAKRLREQTLADRADTRSYEAGVTADTRKYEAGQEAAIDTRELGQAQAATAAANTTEQVRHERDRAESTVKHVTGDEAKAMGLDPLRLYEVGTNGSAKDITHDAPDTFRPPTPEEIKAYKLDPNIPYRVNTKNGKPEAVGGMPPVQMVPSEVGAKLGLADLFLDDFEDIKASAAAGDLTGAYDQPTSVNLGWGKGGETYRKIRQGTEGLMRLLTGAGMPASEAEDRARQYEPKITDDATIMASKLDSLKDAIISVRGGATFGRKSPPAPGGAPDAQQPQQYTVGQTYTFDDGSVGTYKGGPAGDPSSWDIQSEGGQ